MHPLKSAITYKGSTEFTRSELVGILAFKLRLMDVRSAKELIERSIESGLLVEKDGILVINEALLESEEESEDLFNAMVEYLARSLGWDENDVLEGIKAMRERYGDLDERLLAYLFGLDKGVDMSKFKDRLEV
ncbi:DUF2240 family protein [Thermococcus sp. CX2]|uniref:DUF2240 family protein n=1 Tax=Thermococcus sp. CX2 TaxID=163006 RepID=UPI0014395AE7|nr:DUF2240 family protein [Thermococcus sp. CX2]